MLRIWSSRSNKSKGTRLVLLVDRDCVAPRVAVWHWRRLSRGGSAALRRDLEPGARQRSRVRFMISKAEKLELFIKILQNSENFTNMIIVLTPPGSCCPDLSTVIIAMRSMRTGP